MSIIIRLQNLPWDATALNVRQFFYGLSIPDGGVHIIGGEKGDVFIAFSTDEDARQAMKNDGGYIGSTQIKLYLSSKTEMQNVIASAREQNSQPLSHTNTSSMMNPANQFGGLQGSGFPAMRMPFPNQSGVPSTSSRFRGQFDIKEPTNYPNLPFKAPFGPHEFRPGFDPRNPMGPVSDFRPPMMDPRNTNFDQTRFPLPFDQKQSNFPYNKPYQSQSSIDDKTNRNGSDLMVPFQEQRMDDYWNGGDMSMRGPMSNRSMDVSLNDNNSLRKPFGSSGLVMYPPTDLFKKVNEKDRDLEKGGYSDFGDKYSNRSSQQGRDNRFSDFNSSAENEMSKILKNIDDRIAAKKSHPPSLLTTPIDFKLLSVGKGDDSRRQDSGYRQRSRSPSRRDSRYNVGPSGSGGNLRGSELASGSGRSEYGSGSYCLRIENLPTSFTYRDVRNLLKDFEIAKSNLKLLLDKNNRKNGVCLLRVLSLSHAEITLNMDGKMIDGYRISVTRCHDRDFEDAASFLGDGVSRPRSRSRSPPRRESIENGGYYVVIKRLPLTSVLKSLDGVRIHKDGGPFIELKPNGSETGHVLVELERKRDLQEMMDRCKKVFDGHQALIFSINRIEFKDRITGSKILKKEKSVERSVERSGERSSERLAERSTDKSTDSGDTCIRLNGLSWQATEDKVVKFFSGCKIVPRGLHIILDDNGKPSGDAYVEFESLSDCLKALERNNQYLDNRYLVLCKIKKSEMVAFLNKHMSRGGRLMNNSFGNDKPRQEDNNGKINSSSSSSQSRNDRLVPPLMPSDSAPSILFMHNLSFRTQLEDILEFFEGFMVIPDSVQLQYKDDQPTGDGMVQFTSRLEAEKALKLLNRKMMLGRSVRLDF